MSEAPYERPVINRTKPFFTSSFVMVQHLFKMWLDPYRMTKWMLILNDKGICTLPSKFIG